MTPFILLSSTQSNNYWDKKKKKGSFKFYLLLKKFITILIPLQGQTYLVKLQTFKIFVSISGVTKQFACS